MAILDKFHIIRKAIALIQLFACIVVFTFSLILLIIGAITVATANSTNGEFYHTTDYVSGGNLLVVSGLFGIIISIIGALGAVPCLFDRQDNLNLWVGLVILILYILVLVGIFIFEIAAGAWAYNKWDDVSAFLQNELAEDIQKNYGINMGYTASVDELQEQFKCCGINGREDWNASEWKNTNGYGNHRVPLSCCSDPGTATTATPPTIAPNTTNATSAIPSTAIPTPINSTLSERRRAIFRRDSPMNTTIGNTTTTPTVEAVCFTNGAYQTGCWEQIYNTLSSYTVHIAGVTIALAVLQVLILAIPIILLVIVIVELRRSKSLEIK
eukprot:TRINITY_DN600_c0_g1_i2.p1 TRINITY_DN600_c0_g1~~TRINITY_DN600_c0_g1_i2.p1  ORF type:complete len:327 (+),score=39.60 TRINITY_DN600_c0_g1_i2:110-1090(+)